MVGDGGGVFAGAVEGVCGCFESVCEDLDDVEDGYYDVGIRAGRLCLVEGIYVGGGDR